MLLAIPFTFISLIAPSKPLSLAPQPPITMGRPNAATSDDIIIPSNQLLSKYDSGTIVPLKNLELSHSFTILNHGDRVLTLGPLQTSCGCTSASVASSTIAPGQEMTITVSVDPNQLQPGPFEKTVWVYVVGQKDPAATLKITGTALPRANFSTAQIDLGKTNIGQSPSSSVTVTMEQGPIPTGLTQHVVSSNPDLEIQPMGTPAAHEPQIYTVKLLSKAHLGHLQSEISSFWVSPSDHKEYLAGTTNVSVDVIGEITASPTVVGLGFVNPVHPVTQQIIINGKTAADLQATSSSSFLSVQVKPLSTDASSQLSHPFNYLPTSTNTSNTKAMAVLDIALAANAPKDALPAQITVTTSSGQQLQIPVYGTIVPTAKLEAPSQP